MTSFVPTKQFVGAPSSSDIRSSRLGSLQLPSKLSSCNIHILSRPSHPKRLEIQATGSTYGNYFRVTTFGESHGGGVGCIIDGCPPRLPLSESDMQVELDRRRPGQSRITTPRKETDTCKISSGTAEGLTTGSPIKVEVPNTDQRGNDYSEMSLAYRPSHADATYDFKYGVRSVQGGGRSSARETIGRVAAGAVAKKILKLYSGAEVLAYVSQVHQVVLPEDLIDHQTVTLEQIESNIVRCPDPEYAEKMIAAIDAVRVRGDSVGGVGLGTPVFDKLEAELAKACMSLPATKGFEFGSGFAGTASLLHCFYEMSLTLSLKTLLLSKCPIMDDTKDPQVASALGDGEIALMIVNRKGRLGLGCLECVSCWSGHTGRQIKVLLTFLFYSLSIDFWVGGDCISVDEVAPPLTRGLGFEPRARQGTFMTGSEHNDEFYMDEHGRIRTRTNRSGGIQGGISNGEVINMRIAFKPTSTISVRILSFCLPSRKQQTVTRDKHDIELIARGRHDPCVVPRAVPMVEAMVALVLVDQLMAQYAQCMMFPINPELQEPLQSPTPESAEVTL
ncbi:hypothetical protein RND71_014410 [Anisodus tanguticus]|uniref:Chorismate synthase n=1 Tax=Anisodus tanguticus TaxID=243964 RepID=A0AAE1SB73_9SOLA|nr:hypothetical protein RND71_014410 [Anisodus tanguticus]